MYIYIYIYIYTHIRDGVAAAGLRFHRVTNGSAFDGTVQGAATAAPPRPGGPLGLVKLI